MFFNDGKIQFYNGEYGKTFSESIAGKNRIVKIFADKTAQRFAHHMDYIKLVGRIERRPELKDESAP